MKETDTKTSQNTATTSDILPYLTINKRIPQYIKIDTEGSDVHG